MNVLHGLLDGLESVKTVPALENKVITWMGHLADLVRETGDDPDKTAELGANLDENTVTAATAISGKVQELIDAGATEKAAQTGGQPAADTADQQQAE